MREFVSHPGPYITILQYRFIKQSNTHTLYLLYAHTHAYGGAKGQRGGGTNGQRDKGSEGQMGRGAEGRRDWGAEGLGGGCAEWNNVKYAQQLYLSTPC